MLEPYTLQEIDRGIELGLRRTVGNSDFAANAVALGTSKDQIDRSLFQKLRCSSVIAEQIP